MHHNVTRNKYEFKGDKQTIKGWRVDNETDAEVLVDVVLWREMVVITIKDVFINDCLSETKTGETK